MVKPPWKEFGGYKRKTTTTTKNQDVKHGMIIGSCNPSLSPDLRNMLKKQLHTNYSSTIQNNQQIALWPLRKIQTVESFFIHKIKEILMLPYMMQYD